MPKLVLGRQRKAMFRLVPVTGHRQARTRAAMSHDISEVLNALNQHEFPTAQGGCYYTQPPESCGPLGLLIPKVTGAATFGTLRYLITYQFRDCEKIEARELSVAKIPCNVKMQTITRHLLITIYDRCSNSLPKY